MMTRIIVFILIFSPLALWSQITSDQTEDKSSKLNNEDKSLVKIIVPGSPRPKSYSEKSASVINATILISDVPALNWCYGCVPTAAAMLAGYYDRNGYDDIYTGSVNGGVFPLTNSAWGYGECPLSATHMGIEGLSTYGHVDDYYQTENAEGDPYIDAGRAVHTDNCIADYMKTSQWETFENVDGATTMYFWGNGSPLESDHTGDGGLGLHQFFEAKGYNVIKRFNQFILGHEGTTTGFSFDDFKVEIDNNRPVLIHIEGHSMLGLGYDDDSQTIYFHNTWDFNLHSMTWGGIYEGMKHYAVTVLQLEDKNTPVNVSVSIANNNYTYDGAPKQVSISTTPSGIAYSVAYFNESGIRNYSPTNAGVYDVVVTITEPGYTDQGPFYGSLTINKKTLTVRPDNKVINYGDNEPEYTINYSGFVTGETESSLSNPPSAYVPGGWPLPPGNYTIRMNAGDDENYSFSYRTGILTVNPISVNNVDFVIPPNMEYDGNNKYPIVNIDPDGVNYSIAYLLNENIVSSTKNAGTYTCKVTINEVGYKNDKFEATMIVDKAPLLAIVTDTTIVYGEAEPEYNTHFSGFVNDENTTVLDIIPSAYINESWPVLPGTYEIRLSNEIDNNYSIYTQNGLLTVVPNRIDTVFFSDLNYIYDGNSHQATIIPNSQEIAFKTRYINSDGVEVEVVKDAGLYQVEAIITEPGYIQDTFSTSLTINKKMLEITVSDVIAEYGQEEPVFNVEYSGFVNGENLADIDTIPQAGINGSWPLLPGSYEITLFGGADNNYDFSYSNGELTVINSEAFIVVSDTILTYNGSQRQVTVATIPNKLEYEVVYFDSTHTAIDLPINAGKYEVEVTSSESGYDNVTIQTSLTINKAELTIAAKNDTITYGDSLPDLDYSISGFMADDEEHVLDTLPNLQIDTESPLLPGSYTILVSGAQSRNYSFNYHNGTLVVKPLEVLSLTVNNTFFYYNNEHQNITVVTNPAEISKEIIYYNSDGDEITAPIDAGQYKYVVSITEQGYSPDSLVGNIFIEKANLQITADTTIITYGDSIPHIQFNYNGFRGEDTTTVLDSLPSLDEIKGWPWNSGIYSLKVSETGASNYNITCDNVTLIIKPAELVISPNDTTINYGDTLPDFEYSIYGYKYDEDPSVLTSRPSIFTDSIPVNPGQYVLYATGADALNYTFSYQTGILTIDPIGEAAIVISDTVLTYDGKTHELNAIVSPSELNHQITYSDTPINAGEYHVIATVTEPGYLAITDSATIIIKKANLTVTVKDTSILTGEEIPDFEFSISGFVNSETIKVIDHLPIFSTYDSLLVDAGSYPIIFSGASDENYSFSYNNGLLTLIQSYLIKFYGSENGKVSESENDLPTDSLWQRVPAYENSTLIYAIPNQGYVFENWSNGSSENPLMITNANRDTTIIANFRIITDISQFTNNIKFQVYPNPGSTNQSFNIVVDSDQTSDKKIVISDVLGRRISDIEQISGIYQHEELQQGIYFVTLLIDGLPKETLKLLIK